MLCIAKMTVPVVADKIVENVTKFVADAVLELKDNIPGD